LADERDGPAARQWNDQAMVGAPPISDVQPVLTVAGNLIDNRDSIAPAAQPPGAAVWGGS